jgi:hypothetical protein
LGRDVAGNVSTINPDLISADPNEEIKMDLKQIAASIPEYREFLTVDEQFAAYKQLAADFPDLVTIQTVGYSRQGVPIELVSVGNSKENALAIAGAHANETFGSITIAFLSRYLCQHPELRDELGYRWHFMTCLDIDGMRLNEQWFKGEFTPLTYYANFFRPLMPEQPEMLFPIEYKSLKFNRPMPETLALKTALDLLRPKILLSLHNAELGGIYYYMSRCCEPILSLFAEIPSWFGLTLDLGESDQAGYVDKYAPATYRTTTIKDAYNFIASSGVADPASRLDWGGTSNEYAEENFGTFTLLTEVPHWTDERINNFTPTDTSRRQMFLESLDRQEEFFTWLQTQFESVKNDLQLNTPFHRAVSDRIVYYLGRIPLQRQGFMKADDTQRAATVAEQFKVRYWKEHENQRLRGMFVRMIDAEIQAGNRAASCDAARQTVAAKLESVARALENEIHYRRVSIRSAVGVQLCSGLAAAEAISKKC